MSGPNTRRRAANGGKAEQEPSHDEKLAMSVDAGSNGNGAAKAASTRLVEEEERENIFLFIPNLIVSDCPFNPSARRASQDHNQ